MPNYLRFHDSLTAELHGLKNRVRDLVSSNAFANDAQYHHWFTDGEFKESALRAVLRRHLPKSFTVGRGFIVAEHTSSTQIDVLIVDGNKPTLFRDADLMFVTPDCVRAVIEVKTSLRSTRELTKCATKLARAGALCRENGEQAPWLGIFAYEETVQRDTALLKAVAAAYQETEVAINCIAYGKDRFVRYWNEGELERGDPPEAANSARWRDYDLANLASAYFVGNVVDALTMLNRGKNAFAWYPLTDGKRVHMRKERKLTR